MKSAFPVSAQMQNGSSPGSGEMLLPAISGVSSAWERIRLIAAPIRLERTPRRARIALYSSTISSLMSHVNVPLSIQSRNRWALGTSDCAPESRNAEMPATSTEVSTTPLGRFFLKLSNYGDLRCLPSLRSIEFNLIQDFPFRYALQVVGCFLESAGDLFLPALRRFPACPFE